MGSQPRQSKLGDPGRVIYTDPTAPTVPSQGMATTPIDRTLPKLNCQLCRLRAICLPRSLMDEQMERLEEILRRRRPVQRGQVLFHMGQPQSSLYIVRSGSIKCSVALPSHEHIVSFHLPGELVGLDGLENRIHTSSAMALETSSVCELPFGRFEELCREIPALQEQLHRMVGREMAAEHELIALLTESPAEERLAAFLLGIGCRLATQGLSATRFHLSMSRSEIGSFLGMAGETVSRILTSFQKLGLIEVNRKQVLIREPKHLFSRVSLCPGCESLRPLLKQA